MELSIFVLKLYTTATFFTRTRSANLCTVLPNLRNSATLCINTLMVLPRAVPLALLLRIFLWDFTNIYSLKTSLNLFFTSNTLMTLLPFLAMKRNATICFQKFNALHPPWFFVNNSLGLLQPSRFFEWRLQALFHRFLKVRIDASRKKESCVIKTLKQL